MTQYKIEIHGDDNVAVAEALEGLAGLIRLGADDMVATLNEGEVILNMKTVDFTYEHGDYNDDEGNLVHIHADTVVHVTWAGTAKQEDVEIDVGDWMNDHGPLHEVAA